MGQMLDGSSAWWVKCWMGQVLDGSIRGLNNASMLAESLSPSEQYWLTGREIPSFQSLFQSEGK